MKFEFAAAGRVVFGWGTFEQVPALAKEFGRAAMLVLGRSGRHGDALATGLEAVGIRTVRFQVGGEPAVAMVDEAVARARSEGCNLVIAVGGGSVIDAGKAVAGMVNQSGTVLDHLEVVGGGKPLDAPVLPFLAVATTAGTGAEVTRNAVLDVPEHKVKVSLRSVHLLPRVAVVDPELTLSTPPEITAYTGMDALTQLIEPFVSHAANPLTDGLCREGIGLAARSLAAAYRDGRNRPARENMAVAALFGGLALANAKLGAVHGLAGVLGGAFGRPHGAICARLLPFVMDANIQTLEKERADDRALIRYTEVARILTGDPKADAREGVAWVQTLCEELKIPPLAIGSLGSAGSAAIIAGAQRASSMQGNPVKLTDGRLLEILERAD
ncbi:iron-containing alcohol dehydrogenase [Paludisphaera borealis]|uniref:1,3-propanediol dehydrogenase n=1 Tax=Paludisphaera borealis TaxID=1387353 RepID=A0A1U7CU65_9BACT|nr:iron-containing alcohol dehydrogenase [Paludisphaera borealis]APW62439.1 1,3-propanediol dehydrogenase [Paludisphaera borealis]